MRPSRARARRPGSRLTALRISLCYLMHISVKLLLLFFKNNLPIYFYRCIATFKKPSPENGEGNDILKQTNKQTQKTKELQPEMRRSPSGPLGQGPRQHSSHKSLKYPHTFSSPFNSPQCERGNGCGAFFYRWEN